MQLPAEQTSPEPLPTRPGPAGRTPSVSQPATQQAAGGSRATRRHPAPRVVKEASAQVKVAASREAVYDLIADVTRMGEWSPECYRCDWLGGATVAAVGARFRGSNRFGIFRWSRTCEVLSAERGAEFSFRAVPDRMFRSSTRWTFRFAAEADGTLVEQHYHVERHTGSPADDRRASRRSHPTH
jgi:hypothetical protein